MAESWVISEDGLTYTLNLRAGVKFHSTDYFKPTRDFNADDVIFSFERQRLDDHPFNTASGGTWEYFGGMSMPELISDITKIDELTVRITLNRPEAPLISNLAMDFASILSKEYADLLLEAENVEALNQLPIGTGPFKYVAYEQDSQVRYVSHEGYWAGEPNLKELTFAITPDATDRYEKLKAGECHVMAYPNPADLETIQSNNAYQVIKQPGLNIGYLAYNTTVEPYDNAQVRKALNMAINKQAILDAVFQNSGAIATNPIPPTMWSFDESIIDDPYDPAKAKEMLVDAGVTDLQMDVWAMPERRPYNPNARRMAELIQTDMKLVGVDVNIVDYEWGEFLSKSKDLDRPGAVLMGWTGDNGDPDNFLGVLLGCDGVGKSNRAQWCYQPFEYIIQKAKIVSDVEDRTALYKKAQSLFKEQAPWATIAHSVVNKAVRAEVRGFKIDPFGGPIFYGVTVD